MTETTIDRQHTKITLGLVIGLILLVGSGSYYVGKIDSRINNLEQQVKAHWLKMSKIDIIVTQQAVMDGKLDLLLRSRSIIVPNSYKHIE